MKILLLMIALQFPVDMLILFKDGTESNETVERSICEELNEAGADPDKLLYAYYPPSGQLKQILMVLCRGDQDNE
jgi:hypothetical protein